MRNILVTLLMLFSLVEVSTASRLQSSKLSELQEKSDIIVVAKIISVTPVSLLGRVDKSYDEVTLVITNLFKGDSESMKINIITEPRGVRGFDPALKSGQSGVFFLKKTEKFGYRLTSYGSASIFERGNFVLEESKQGIVPNL